MSMRWRVVKAEATSGLMLAGGAAAVVVAVVLCVIAGTAPLWAERTRVATFMCAYLVPLMIGITAIVSGRRMQGLSALTAASPAGSRHPAVIAGMAGSLWAGLVFLVLAVLPVVLIPPSDPVLLTALLSWPQALVSLLAAAWIGAAVGVRFRGRLVGPLLASVTFGLIYFSRFLEGRWLLAAPFESPWYVPWIQPAAGVPVGHTLIGIATLLTVGAYLSNRSSRAVASTALVAALVASVGVAAIASVPNPQRYEVRPMTADPICEPVGPHETFCAHPMSGTEREATVSALRTVRAAIGDLWSVPSRMVHYNYPAGPDDVFVPMAYGHDDVDTNLSNAAHGLRPTCADTELGRTRQDNVHWWLLVKLGLHRPAPDDPLIDVFTLPEDKQVEWVEDQLQAGSCQ